MRSASARAMAPSGPTELVPRLNKRKPSKKTGEIKKKNEKGAGSERKSEVKQREMEDKGSKRVLKIPLLYFQKSSASAQCICQGHCSFRSDSVA